MQPDRRKHRRVALKRPCWVSVAEGHILKQCTLNNISVEGAGIAVPVASDLDDLFEIHFTRDGSVSFGAKIIWQNGDSVGVQFTDRPKRAK
jgi:hypothetical protein